MPSKFGEVRSRRPQVRRGLLGRPSLRGQVGLELLLLFSHSSPLASDLVEVLVSVSLSLVVIEKLLCHCSFDCHPIRDTSLRLHHCTDLKEFGIIGGPVNHVIAHQHFTTVIGETGWA